jgi:hypothetical protein
MCVKLKKDLADTDTCTGGLARTWRSRIAEWGPGFFNLAASYNLKLGVKRYRRYPFRLCESREMLSLTVFAVFSGQRVSIEILLTIVL